MVRETLADKPVRFGHIGRRHHRRIQFATKTAGTGNRSSMPFLPRVANTHWTTHQAESASVKTTDRRIVVLREAAWGTWADAACWEIADRATAVDREEFLQGQRQAIHRRKLTPARARSRLKLRSSGVWKPRAVGLAGSN